MKKHILFVLLLTAVLSFCLIGCSKAAKMSENSYGYKDAVKKEYKIATPAMTSDFDMSASEMQSTAGRLTYAKAITSENAAGTSASKPGEFNKKMIRTCDIELKVEKVEETKKKVAEIVTSADGYIVNEQVSQSGGRNRRASISIRVPVAKFFDMKEELETLGEVRKSASKGKDVTEEYVDVESQIKNLKKEEETILKILDRPSLNIKDVLEVERELSRVRGLMEHFQGRLRYLENQSSYSTIDLVLFEEEVIATKQEWAISSSFNDATRSMLAFTRSIIDILIWVSIFSPFWLLPIIIFIVIVRRHKKLVALAKKSQINT